MKVLITGSTGFIGKTVVQYLYTHGIQDIAIIVRNVDKANSYFLNLALTVISVDESMKNRIISYSPDIVLHLATYFTSKSDDSVIDSVVNSNILFGTQVLEAISHTQCKYFINIGTFTEFLYGAGEYLPNNLYSATKNAFRSIIRYYQLVSDFKWINVIVYSPYGRYNDHKKIIDLLIESIDSKDKIELTGGEQRLDFIHVDDIADFFYTLIDHINLIDKNYIQFYLGTGKTYSIREVAVIIEQVFQKKLNLKWGSLEYRKFDPMFAVAPISKNLDILNWKPKIELEDGIRILKYDRCR